MSLLRICKPIEPEFLCGILEQFTQFTQANVSNDHEIHITLRIGCVLGNGTKDKCANNTLRLMYLGGPKDLFYNALARLIEQASVQA
jgi:hypothetical protein